MYSFPAKSELGIDLLRNTNLIFDQCNFHRKKSCRDFVRIKIDLFTLSKIMVL